MKTTNNDHYRATEWDDYIGQTDLKARLDRHAQMALRKRTTMGNVLLAGPAGAGKTTLAEALANRLGVPFSRLVMPIMFKDLLRDPVLRRGEGVILLDEFHGLAPGSTSPGKLTQETFLTVFEDQRLTIPNGKVIPVGGITWVVATTELQKIIKPIQQRLKIRPEFVEFTDQEMTQILLGMAKRAKIRITAKVAAELAPACAGRPRQAQALLEEAETLTYGRHKPTAAEICEAAGVSPDGLEAEHRKYLAILLDNGGEKMGERALAQRLSCHPAQVNELEMLLHKRGLIEFSGAGRSLTIDGWDKATELDTTDALDWAS